MDSIWYSIIHCNYFNHKTRFHLTRFLYTYPPRVVIEYALFETILDLEAHIVSSKILKSTIIWAGKPQDILLICIFSEISIFKSPVQYTCTFCFPSAHFFFLYRVSNFLQNFCGNAINSCDKVLRNSELADDVCSTCVYLAFSNLNNSGFAEKF